MKSRSGGRRPFLAGLGGEGENVSPSEKGVVDELLAGRGGEEERAHASASSSASFRRPYLHWIRATVVSHRLGFSLACRGGEEGEAADATPTAHRSQLLPKRCFGVASSSPSLLSMQRSSREVFQRGNYAGDALPLHLLADWRPFSWSSDFPKTKMSKGKSYCFCHGAGPSGSSPAPAFVLWRSNSAATLFCGAEQGPDRIFQNLFRAFSVIFQLKHNNGWVTEHEAKEEIAYNHFHAAIGRGGRRNCYLNWEELLFEDPGLQSLGDPFSEEEVRNAINLMPSDKAPGPNGYTGAFFKKCWDIIKVDVMEVVHLFGDLHAENFHWLNSANIVLLPKKEGAEEIVDYRPISLIHAIAKIIAKMLSIRLGPYMDSLVSNAQSAFIKKRSIHDNFLYVKNLATRLHKSKTSALLFKLDIRKAFDNVRWDYIVDLLQKRGFPSRFRNWIVALLTTSSSRVLLNGVAGLPIRHGRGLRQGDPLSPLLFVLAIDPLAQILERATTFGLLHKLRGRRDILRTSLYADDAAVFVAPFKEDIQNLANILGNFGDATGLCTNFQKSAVAPIRCEALDLDAILEDMPATRTTFPMRYLGLPLSVRCLKRRDMQHLEDKCAGKLPTWNGNLITTRVGPR
ncbi:hypothetical protein QYE76_056714 [Lolium multiflorum]|uniref:Reverse transcriptase domain-containing protein n=1 Tax=Lolium multiflorum TaxID=4521 RepID=A0AAD8T317_LOLMU|nr:hypothetical protein QYE76_056714 [Lolium multiflorum]